MTCQDRIQEVEELGEEEVFSIVVITVQETTVNMVEIAHLGARGQGILEHQIGVRLEVDLEMIMRKTVTEIATLHGGKQKEQKSNPNIELL